jgi:hypothetical protein
MALTVYSDQLIAGGLFASAGGLAVNNIAAWDGSQWSPLGEGINGGVHVLAEYNGRLIAGGTFDSAGSIAANNIAAWDGSTWSSLGSGMNDQVVALADYNNQLWVGGHFTTAGDKVSAYIATWDEFATDTDDDTPDIIPESFHLAQNYPNPFNPSTNIEFDLPSRAHVTLEIFNVLGQKVRTLIDEDRAAGPYRVIWDGTDDANHSVSTGVYLYRLKTGDLAEVKKMVLLK